MNAASRPVSTGKTRICPHCKATILESLSICPGCLHHLRFDSEAAKRQVAAAPALRVEGMIRHPPLEAPLEYFVIIAIRNDRGERGEVTRQVVNVGALQAAEKRTFTLSVEVLPPSPPANAKSTSTTGSFKVPAQSAVTVRPQTPTPASEGKSQAPPLPPAGSDKSSATPRPAAPAQAGPSATAGATPTVRPTADPGQSGQAGYPGGLKPPVPGGGKRH